MKKIVALGMMVLLIFASSLAVFAADNSVPFIGGGAIIEIEPLTEEERQTREDAYHDILALSKTDDNIIAVKLSKDFRWIFLQVSGDPDTQKEYAKKFDQYGEFLILTDDAEKSVQTYTDTYSIGYLDGTAGIMSPKPKNYDNIFWSIGLCGMVFLGAAFLLIKQRRLLPGFQTADGKVLTNKRFISKKEIILTVKQNESVPDEKVFDSIIKELNGNRK